MEDDYTDYTIEQMEALVDEETGKWTELGINLDQISWSGSEIFQLKCQLQALINCHVKEIRDEEGMQHEIKEVILNSMIEIRESIEPQVREAKLQMLQQRLKPKLQMPWERPPGGNRN